MPGKRSWFFITPDYRKLEIRTNRTSPRGAPRKRHRRVATGREQNRRAEHRWDAALSAERQRTAVPQTKHHPAATCTNSPVCISARSRGVSQPRTFTLATSFSRLYAHLRAPASRRRVSPTRAVGRTGPSGAFVVTACVAQTARPTPSKRVIHPLAGVSRRRAVSKIPWYSPLIGLDTSVTKWRFP